MYGAVYSILGVGDMRIRSVSFCSSFVFQPRGKTLDHAWPLTIPYKLQGAFPTVHISVSFRLAKSANNAA